MHSRSTFCDQDPAELFWDVSLLQYQEEFDLRPKRTEKQLLNAFGIRALAVQVDLALAYFEFKSGYMNCSNQGVFEELSKRRVVLFESYLRIQAKDTGMFAATTGFNARGHSASQRD